MATNTGKPLVEANGIKYRWPQQPVVVVCIDGGDPAYFQQFLADGAIPNIARFIGQGFSAVADGTMPSFTCPNNMSIITGTPASRHGISGNYYLDTATGKPVVMTGPELLRGDTILSQFAAAGAQSRFDHREGQAAQAARQESRRLERQHQLLLGVRSSRCTLKENGIEDALEFVGMAQPDMYSMELSLFVLEGGHQASRARPSRPDVPLAHRLGAAQVRAGGIRGKALLSGARRALRHGSPISAPPWR